MTNEQEQRPQVDTKAAQKGGRKRKRASEIAPGVRRMIPDALRISGDLERVAEEYGIAKVECLAVAVVDLLRKGPGRAPNAVQLDRRRLFLVEREAA